MRIIEKEEILVLAIPNVVCFRLGIHLIRET